MPSNSSATEIRSQVRSSLRLSSSFPTSDWCATLDSGCPSISLTPRRVRKLCYRSSYGSNGICSGVSNLASGRTFDPNPACTDLSVGRMFLDITDSRTSTTVVGSLRLLGFYVYEAMSQLVSPQLTTVQMDPLTVSIYVVHQATIYSRSIMSFRTIPKRL